MSLLERKKEKNEKILIFVVCTSIYYIRKRKNNEIRDIHDLMELFFEIDARDDQGLTPLQLALANFRPDMVDILLDHGADLSKFVFPDASNIAERFKNCKYEFELELASGALSCLERLEKRGYETKRSDALTIMGLFKEYKLFAKSEDLKESFKKKKFEFVAKKFMIKSKYGASFATSRMRAQLHCWRGRRM
ncbi:hypothetical protein TKK_0004968 [Trichogramma kaykai]